MRRAAALLAAAALLLTGAGEPDPRTATEVVVKPGETLGGIASRTQVPRVLIIEANALKPPYAVKAGQKLVIPRRRTHTVKAGETGFSIAMDYGVAWSGIAAANGLNSKEAVKPGQKLVIPTLIKALSEASALPAGADKTQKAATDKARANDAAAAKSVPGKTPPGKTGSGKALPAPAIDVDDADPPVSFAWPLSGKVRREFAARGGKGAFHDGIDVLAAKGAPVRASAAGTVIFAGDGPMEYGKTVILHHGKRWTTVYSYLDKITVKLGDKVKAGERIGLNGQSGLAGDPQMHFEVRHNRGALNPMRYLPKR